MTSRRQLMSLQKRLWKTIQKQDFADLQSFLLKMGQDASFVLEQRHKSSGDSVIHLASRFGLLDFVTHFHQHYRIGLELKNLDQKTPLHEAAAGGHVPVVQYLLDYKVDVDPLKKSDWTPLMLACTKADNVSVIRLLIEKGADVQLVNKDGWNSFHIACRTGCVRAIRLLYATNHLTCSTASNNGRTPLHTAALHGNFETVHFLIVKCKCRVDIQDSCGSTALMETMKAGSVNCARFMLESGANVDTCDKMGRTSLHVAAECNHHDLIRLLVEEYGVSPNQSTFASCNHRLSALFWAYKEKQLDAVKLLKELGAVDSVT